MRIGVFGGSFDPVHNGHLIIARLAAEQLQLDQVRFVVAAAQPFKVGHHGASANDRFRMVQLAIAGLDDFVADDQELRREGPSYTVDTVTALSASIPHARLSLIMGADTASRFTEWRSPEKIRELAQIAVCRRPGSAAGREFGMPERFGTEIDIPQIDISSTAIRARIRAKMSVIGWVPQSVADYIVASQVYVE